MVADVWVNDYTGEPARPAAESASAHRVFRGGSWANDAGTSAAAYRYHVEPLYRHYDLGFRCAEFREGLVSGGEGRAENASERLAEPRGDREPARPGASGRSKQQLRETAFMSLTAAGKDEGLEAGRSTAA